MNSPALASSSNAPAPAIDLRGAYLQHAVLVHRWARRFGASAEQADDIVQDVFLIVQGKLDSFRFQAQLSTWLYKITFHVTAHQGRKRSRRRRLDAALDRDVAGPQADEEADPLRRLEGLQRRTIVEAILAQLPERERTVLVLSELHGLTGSEIAEILGCNKGSVWVVMHRARSRFRKLWADQTPAD
jgi:RNA polymerase sigma-70 factor (ECF subfamily)